MEKNSKENATNMSSSEEEEIYGIKTLDTLLSKKYPPTQWIVDNLIPEEAIVIMSAKPASYKTWLAYQMALSVSMGEKFLGQFKTEQSAVLIVDGEAGERQMYNRLLALGAKKDMPIYYQTMLGGNKIDKAYRDKLLAFCAVNKVKLIIFDSLVRFLNVKDENSAMDVAEAFKGICSFKKAGITTFFVAHNRKSNSSYGSGGTDDVRGSGDITASCDIHLAINRGSNNTITVYQHKNRLDVETFSFRAKLVKESSTSSVWQFLDVIKTTDVNDSVKKSITEMLSNSESLNQKQIRETLLSDGMDIGEKKIRALLNEMKVDGQLSSQKGNRTEILYALERGEQNG